MTPRLKNVFEVLDFMGEIMLLVLAVGFIFRLKRDSDR
jgi:hypothetical protein